MDAYVQLALIEKSKLVFATDAGVFLSFPLLSPLTYTVPSLAALAAPQTAADYAAAADFARTVNFLPRDMVASPDSDRYLWDVYGDVLARAEVAGSSSAAVDQAAAAETLLYDTASDGTRTETAAYRAYRQYRDAWIVAREDYGAHKLTGEMTTDADAARHWLQVEEPALRTALASAENDWKTLGRRDDIDAALQAEHDAAVNDPRPRWQQWAAAFNPDVDLLSDAAGGGHYAPTGLSPKDFGSDGTWLHFDLSAGEMANLVANAPAELKVVLDGSTSTVEHVSFDYRSVAILRPWFNSSALTSRIWRSDDPQLNLSDGGDPPGGACPAYATAVVFIRNLEVTQRAADPAPAGPVDLRFTLAANRLTRRNLQFTPRIMLERAPSTAAPAPPIAINAQIAFRRLDRQSLAVAPESVARSAIAPMRFRPSISMQFNPGLINAVLANRLHVPIQVGPADPPQPQPTQTPTPTPAPPPPPPPRDDISILAFICKRLPKTPDAMPTLHWG
ncbi:hypothetical protein KX816_03815 [Sphingosinicellaceae bacterium]|nr:hypothetical protein KX816_03815 [Sphingosinicellaceae bacterium]